MTKTIKLLKRIDLQVINNNQLIAVVLSDIDTPKTIATLNNLTWDINPSYVDQFTDKIKESINLMITDYLDKVLVTALKDEPF